MFGDSGCVRRAFVSIVILMTCFPALGGERYTIKTTGHEQQRFIPAKLVDIALSRAKHHKGKEHSWYLYQYLNAYRDYLLVGGGAYCSCAYEVEREAFLQGINDARNGVTDAIPDDFGYTRGRLEGRFVIEFEGDRFQPNGSKGWREALAFRLGKNVSIDEIAESEAYLIEGWLSPKASLYAGYGHMAAYKQEVIVLRVCARDTGCI